MIQSTKDDTLANGHGRLAFLITNITHTGYIKSVTTLE